MKGIFISGTDTDVGKTHVARRIARHLSQQGISVAARKPVESGCRQQEGELLPADALALQEAAGHRETLQHICPFRFEPAISPHRAAQLAGRTCTIAELTDACRRHTDDEDFLLVEGAGGFYSPLCEDGLNADLAQALGLPILLVAEDRLGCINQILLSKEAIEHRKLQLAAIALNQIQASAPSMMDNFTELSGFLDTPLFRLKPSDNIHTAEPALVQWLDSFLK